MKLGKPKDKKNQKEEVQRLKSDLRTRLQSRESELQEQIVSDSTHLETLLYILSYKDLLIANGKWSTEIIVDLVFDLTKSFS